MIERGRGARLLLEAAHSIVVPAELFEQDFDGDFAPQPLVLGQIDLAHSARAELPENAIVRNRLSDHSRAHARTKKRKIENWDTLFFCLASFCPGGCAATKSAVYFFFSRVHA